MRSRESTYTSGPNTIDLQSPLILLRRRAAVTAFRRRRRVFVILIGGAAVPLEHAHNLAEEAFLFSGLFLRLDTGGRLRVPVGGGRRQSFLGISAEHAGEEPLHTAALVAGIARLGAGDEGNRVIVGARRRRQAVGDFIEFHIHHALGLGKGLHVRILWQSNRFLHELGPNGGGSLRAAQAKVAVIVVSHPDDAKQIAGVAGEPAVV